MAQRVNAAIHYVPLDKIKLRKTYFTELVDADLVESIKDLGFLSNPCVVVRKSTVVDGNKRIQALRSLTRKELAQALSAYTGKIPVIVLT